MMIAFEKWRNYEEEKNSWQCLFLLFFCSLHNRRVCLRSQLSFPIPMPWNDRWHINLGWKEHYWYFFQRKTNIRVEKRPDAVNLSVPLISSHDLWDARDVFAAFSLGFRNKTFWIFPDGFNKVKLQCMWRYLFFLYVAHILYTLE